MEKLKGFVATCLGLGIAMITGFYFYRSFTSKDGGDENSETIATEQATEVMVWLSQLLT